MAFLSSSPRKFTALEEASMTLENLSWMKSTLLQPYETSRALSCTHAVQQVRDYPELAESRVLFSKLEEAADVDLGCYIANKN